LRTEQTHTTHLHPCARLLGSCALHTLAGSSNETDETDELVYFFFFHNFIVQLDLGRGCRGVAWNKEGQVSSGWCGSDTV